jgi:hypothetical protein
LEEGAQIGIKESSSCQELYLVMSSCDDDAITEGHDTFVGFLKAIYMPLLLSVFINCFLFVGELAMLTTNKNNRSIVDGFAHILTGPVSIIAFYQPDTLASVLFFGCLWHFLCDCAETRPTYLLLFPWAGVPQSMQDNVGSKSTPSIAYFRWTESLLIFLHHIFIGTVKVALDRNVIAPIKFPVLLFIFIAGAGLAHLSFGMSVFRIKFAFKVLVVSQLLRFGADSAIVALTWGTTSDWQFLMLGDLCWLVIYTCVKLGGSARLDPSPMRDVATETQKARIKKNDQQQDEFGGMAGCNCPMADDLLVLVATGSMLASESKSLNRRSIAVVHATMESREAELTSLEAGSTTESHHSGGSTI